MVSRFRWLAATTVAVAVAATAAGLAAVTGAAQAAPAPGWRIAAVYPEDSGVYTITAASANNAWALENCTRPCHTGSDGYTLRHWNGRHWLLVAAKPAHAVGGNGLLGIAPGAASRPWTMYSYKTFRQTAVAHWMGTSWSAPTLLSKNASFSVDVVPSSASIWAFGSVLSTGRPYAVRYNGRSWSAAPAPGVNVLSASAASPADIWVTGTRAGAARTAWPMAVSHWNGKKWTTSTLPRIPVPSADTAQPLSIVASGSGRAWAFGFVSSAGRIVPNDGLALYHWNGAKWSPVTVPYQQTEAFSIASDGHGGIWFWAERDPGHHDYLIHDSASGHWSRVTDPRPAGAFSVQTDTITAIPGSASLWAAGFASVPIPIGGNPGGTKGLILKYGD